MKLDKIPGIARLTTHVIEQMISWPVSFAMKLDTIPDKEKILIRGINPIKIVMQSSKNVNFGDDLISSPIER